MNGAFWVNPDRLAQSGAGYSVVGEQINAFAVWTSELPWDYREGFGDDEEGTEFWTTFRDGHQQIVDGLAGIGLSVSYVGDGVTGSGRSFGDARDYADDSTYQFNAQIAEDRPAPAPGTPPVPVQSRLLRPDEKPVPLKPTTAYVTYAATQPPPTDTPTHMAGGQRSREELPQGTLPELPEGNTS
ncbi:MAG: hypothetical protein ABW215_20095 [Kibdelosporangium sp.]